LTLILNHSKYSLTLIILSLLFTKKRKFKTVPKRSGGGIAELGSGSSITAEQIKNQFFAHASS
jgi:hypothetical protein